jgi:hypothetical protein
LQEIKRSRLVPESKIGRVGAGSAAPALELGAWAEHAATKQAGLQGGLAHDLQPFHSILGQLLTLIA